MFIGNYSRFTDWEMFIVRNIQKGILAILRSYVCTIPLIKRTAMQFHETLPEIFLHEKVVSNEE